MTEKQDVPERGSSDVKGIWQAFEKGHCKPWTCMECGFLLGVLDKKHQWVRIKFRDLYVLVQEGTVLQTCRRCGRINKIEGTGR